MTCGFVPRTFPKPDSVFMFTTVFKLSMKSECFCGPVSVAILNHLEEVLNCGSLALRCVRLGEFAWHVSCNLGLGCEAAICIAPICDARRDS